MSKNTLAVIGMFYQNELTVYFIGNSKDLREFASLIRGSSDLEEFSLNTNSFDEKALSLRTIKIRIIEGEKLKLLHQGQIIVIQGSRANIDLFGENIEWFANNSASKPNTGKNVKKIICTLRVLMVQLT